MLLKEKVAVITGAAQGIGAAFARGYAQEGARIVIADIQEGQETVAAVKEAGGRAFYVKTDVTRPQDCEAMALAAVERFGRIDILLNNAAMYAHIVKKPLSEISLNEWNQVMQVNVNGPFLCTQAVLPYMQKTGGKIINVSSSVVFEAPPGFPHYVASKGAVYAFTRCVARELGQYNINVNALAPGYTLSDGSRHIEKNRTTAGPSPDVISIEKRCLKRSALPEDMVGTAVFLGSRLSDFITGQLILCDGGASHN